MLPYLILHFSFRVVVAECIKDETIRTENFFNRHRLWQNDALTLTLAVTFPLAFLGSGSGSGLGFGRRSATFWLTSK